MTGEKTQTPPDLTGWRRFLAPSLGDVLFISLFSFALTLGANLTNRDGDLGRHIRLGLSVIKDGSIPTVDTYSHTMFGSELIPHWWLAQTIFAGAEDLYGFDGIGLLTAIMAGLPWLILYRWMVKRGTPVWLSAGLCILGAVASMIHWASRPHIFTWLFVAIWVMALEDLRIAHRKQVWLLVPLTVIWANTHAGFIVGYTLLGTYLLGSAWESWRDGRSPVKEPRTKHLLTVLLATVAISFVTPAGFDTIVNAFSYLGEDFLIDFTSEYATPNFHSPLAWPFLGMILLTIGLSHKWTPTQLLLVLSWTAFGLYSLRNIPLYAIVITPMLATHTARQATRGSGPQWLRTRIKEYAKTEQQLVGGSLAIAFVIVVSVAVISSPGSAYGFSDGEFPISAMDSLDDGPPGKRPFHMFTWGGYLEYCCHPKILTFIDGQTDLYGSDLTMQYQSAVRGGADWREIFETHRIDWVVISPRSGLAQVLSEADDWTESYRDETTVIFVPS